MSMSGWITSLNTCMQIFRGSVWFPSKLNEPSPPWSLLNLPPHHPYLEVDEARLELIIHGHALLALPA